MKMRTCSLPLSYLRHVDHIADNIYQNIIAASDNLIKRLRNE